MTKTERRAFYELVRDAFVDAQFIYFDAEGTPYEVDALANMLAAGKLFEKARRGVF